MQYLNDVDLTIVQVIMVTRLHAMYSDPEGCSSFLL